MIHSQNLITAPAAVLSVIPKDLVDIPAEDECLICSTNKRNTLLKPCNHLISCKACSRDFMECLICNEPIQQMIEIDKCMRCHSHAATLIIDPCKHAFSCFECSLANKRCFKCHALIDKYTSLRNLCPEVDKSFTAYNSNKRSKSLMKSNFSNDFLKAKEFNSIKEKVRFFKKRN
jgi:hypothetical protein